MSVSDGAAAEFRQVGHRLVELLADYLDRIEELDVFPDAAPVELEKLFGEPLPREGVPLADVVAELEEKLLPYCTHVGHPGYFGFITPSPLPAGALADLVASVLNQNPGAWAIGPGAVAIERRVVRWLCDLVGYDRAAGGNLTSGGMMANFIGLKLARDAVSGDRAQHEGVAGGWAVYTSDERHVASEQARRLYDLAEADPEFEGAVWPSMSSVCIGFRGAGIEEESLTRLHAQVVRRVEEGGRFWITTTRLKGRPWFRVNPVNFRTRLEHMDRSSHCFERSADARPLDACDRDDGLELPRFAGHGWACGT